MLINGNASWEKKKRKKEGRRWQRSKPWDRWFSLHFILFRRHERSLFYFPGGKRLVARNIKKKRGGKEESTRKINKKRQREIKKDAFQSCLPSSLCSKTPRSIHVAYRQGGREEQRALHFPLFAQYIMVQETSEGGGGWKEKKKREEQRQEDTGGRKESQAAICASVAHGKKEELLRFRKSSRPSRKGRERRAN